MTRCLVLRVMTLVATLMMASTPAAQGGATGTVVDVAGLAVAGAAVELRMADGRSVTVTTGPTGASRSTAPSRPCA